MMLVPEEEGEVDEILYCMIVKKNDKELFIGKI